MQRSYQPILPSHAASSKGSQDWLNMFTLYHNPHSLQLLKHSTSFVLLRRQAEESYLVLINNQYLAMIIEVFGQYQPAARMNNQEQSSYLFIIESLFLMKEDNLESAPKQTFIIDPFSNRKRKRKMQFYSYEPRQPQPEPKEESAKKNLFEVDEREFSPLRPIQLKNRLNGWVEPFQLQDKKAATFRMRRLSKNRQQGLGSEEGREALSPDHIKHLKTILKKLQTPQRVQETALLDDNTLSSSRGEHEVQIISLPRRAQAAFRGCATHRVAKKKVINYSAYKQNRGRRGLAESACVQPQLLRSTLIIREAGRRRDLRG